MARYNSLISSTQGSNSYVNVLNVYNTQVLKCKELKKKRKHFSKLTMSREVAVNVFLIGIWQKEQGLCGWIDKKSSAGSECSSSVAPSRLLSESLQLPICGIGTIKPCHRIVMWIE